MRSGITRRWLRGNLLITVLLVLLAETMFLYNYTRSYYNSVQQTMYRRFSSVSGQLKMYTGDTVQSTAATRSVALRRMVEQFADKDKYEFMLLDSYGGVIASSSGTNADGIVTGIDFEQAQDAVGQRRGAAESAEHGDSGHIWFLLVVFSLFSHRECPEKRTVTRRGCAFRRVVIQYSQ